LHGILLDVIFYDILAAALVENGDKNEDMTGDVVISM
jgi:hypothetical protein